VWTAVATIQGAYYLATGLWPLVSRRSFEAVTGPKNDFWLVETLGLLISAVGSALLVSSTRERLSPETAALGVTCAAALGGAGGFFALQGRISKIYLADAALEALLIAAWAAAQQKDVPTQVDVSRSKQGGHDG
jgi:hypothetical protein